MSSHVDPRIPKPVMWAIGAVVGVTFLLTGSVAVGLMDRPKPASAVRAEQGVARVAERTLVFADREDGALVIAEPGRTDAVEVLEPGSNEGFIRGVMRSMSRERRMRGVGPEEPYRLILWADGRLSLLDEATGRTVELDSFGADNRAAFRALLPARPGGAA